MRRSNKKLVVADEDEQDGYFTYRPLSSLPTPPPSSRASAAALQAFDSRAGLDEDELLDPKYRGASIHLVNLIPASASLACASIGLVQAMLGRAALPLETVALAACILDSLDARFARRWRLSCPLRHAHPSSLSAAASYTPSGPSSSKRHTLPPSLPLEQRPQLHIDTVSPEIMVLAALVIAAKFTEDPQESTQYYCALWGRHTWSSEQFNTTERCIMESLNYRILPLCDEECLSMAMVDMQLAAYHDDHHHRHHPGDVTPPSSGAGSSDDDLVRKHSRSKTGTVPVPSLSASGSGDAV